MRAFLRFVVRGRVYAIAAATTAAMLSVILAVMVVVFPPLFFAGVVAYFASASIVGLVALKFGLLEALVVMLGPALFWAAPLVAGSEVDAPAALLAVPMVSTVVGILLPVALMGEVLRRTRSQALAFGLGAGLLAAVTVVFHIVDFELLRWLTSEMLPALKRSMPEVDWQVVSRVGEDGVADPQSECAGDRDLCRQLSGGADVEPGGREVVACHLGQPRRLRVRVSGVAVRARAGVRGRRVGVGRRISGWLVGRSGFEAVAQRAGSGFVSGFVSGARVGARPVGRPALAHRHVFVAGGAVVQHLDVGLGNDCGDD